MDKSPIITSPPPVQIPISVLLRQFLNELKTEQFTVQEFILGLGDRSFGMLLLLMALPNALMLATLPLVSTIFGTVLVFGSIQMILRRTVLWLPQYMSNKKLSKEKFLHLLESSQNALVRIELYLKPRWIWLSSDYMEKVWGIICLINSLLIMLPIWFGNFLPGWAVVFFAVGILTKDGLYLCLGVIMSVISWIVLMGIYGGLFQLIHKLLE